MTLLNQAKNLPNKHGVYMFLNKQGEILYIGRATSLRNRVASYFRKDIDLRIREMVELAVRIKHIITETIFDSVILEANLIKKHWPKYNVREKDDRSFVYIIIDKGDYPKPIIIRGKELTKFPSQDFLIFGPYKSLRVAKEILKIARKIFPYSLCSSRQGKSHSIGSGRACFHYQLGLCPGVCVGKISQKYYKKNIDNLILFLSGEKKRLLKKLMKENPEKAESLKYIQDAALLKREDIGGGMSGMTRVEGYDVSHFAGKETYGSMVVFSDGEENKDEYRLFKIKTAPANDDLAALKEIIERRLNHKEWPLPDLMLVDGGKPQVNYIWRILQDKKNIPIVGISKLHNDALVFPPGTKQPFKELAEASKNLLLRIRNEAHRFANFARKRKSKVA